MLKRGSELRPEIAAAASSVPSTSADGEKPTSSEALDHSCLASVSCVQVCISYSNLVDPGLCSANRGSSAAVPAAPSLTHTYAAPISSRASLSSCAERPTGHCMRTSWSAASVSSACSIILTRRAPNVAGCKASASAIGPFKASSMIQINATAANGCDTSLFSSARQARAE